MREEERGEGRKVGMDNGRIYRGRRDARQWASKMKRSLSSGLLVGSKDEETGSIILFF